MNAFAGDYQTPERMALKRRAIPLPDLAGKRVLDIGCDHGYWSFLAAELGAASVLGIDRNRDVRGVGPVNLVAQNEAIARADARYRICHFRRLELGRQWHDFSPGDVVLMFSVYHHVFENCGDHASIWYWLHRHCEPGAELLWEGPVDDSDPVVRANVTFENRARYTREQILAAARDLFEAEPIGPALHVPTREVWRFRRREVATEQLLGTIVAGAGGATAAFEYAGGRRIGEIGYALGWRPYPGSLNVRLDQPFDWNDRHYRAEILDVVQRGRGLEVEWSPRWVRFYPLTIDGVDACAMRFEGERYPPDLLELIAPWRLRDRLTSGSGRVTIAR